MRIKRRYELANYEFKVFIVSIIILIATFIGTANLFAQNVRNKDTGTYVPPGVQQNAQEQKEKPSILERKFKEKAQMMENLSKSKAPIYIYAQWQEYRTKEHLMIYRGNVVLTRGTLTVKADKIIFNTFTREGSLEGDIELHFNQDLITAERGKINIDTNEMHLEKCRGIIEPSLFFECDVLERLYPEPEKKAGRYYFKNALFTPCNQLTPNWSMKAHEVYAVAEQYMHMFGSAFLIKNFPVFWFPYWFYPIKTNRSTGFLVPSFGYSSRDGYKIRNEFFWVVADNADLTLTQIHKGVYRNEGKAEFRYALDPFSLGDFLVRYIREMKDPFTKEVIPDNERDIYLLKANQTHRFPGNINWRLSIDYQNNPRINTLYYETTAQQSQSFTNSWAGFSKNWSSLLTSLDATYYESSILNSNRDHSLQHLPVFTISVPQKRYKFSGLYYSLYSQISQIALFDTYDFPDDPDTPDIDETDSNKSFFADEQRIHLAPRLKFLLPKRKTWFQITTQCDFWFTQWSRQKTVFDENFDWNIYSATLKTIYFENEEQAIVKEVRNGFGANTYKSGTGLAREGYKFSMDFAGPILYRIFNTSSISENIKRLKHRFWPGITLNYTPEINQNLIINFDPYIDYLPPAKGITYYFKSDIIGRVYDKINKRLTVRSLANFSIWQNFDFRLSKLYEAQLDRNQNRELVWQDDPLLNHSNHIYPARNLYPQSNVVTRLELFPSKKIWFLGTTSYDPYWGILQRSNVDLYVQEKKFYLRTGWGKNLGLISLSNKLDDKELFSADDIEYIYSSVGGQITGHWAVVYNIMYDMSREKFHHANLAIIYDAQCWGVTFSFLSRQYTDQSLYVNPDETERIALYQDEYNFSFMINLKHLGSIGGYDYVEGGFGLAQ